MKKKLFFISLFFIVIFGGCGGNKTPLRPTPILTTITISPLSAKVPLNTTLEFILNGYDQNGMEMSFSPVFTVDPLILGEIISDGQKVIFEAKKEGSGKIIVASESNTNIKASADIEVISSGIPPVDIWQKTYGGIKNDYASSITRTQDGGYIVAGGTNSQGTGGYDVYVVKLNSQGNKLWEKVYGSTSDDYASSVQQTQDGGYILAGGINFIYRNDTSGDAYILKLDGLGNKLWEKVYGGTSGDYASFVQQTQDGGYIVAGWTTSSNITGYSGGYDAYILKLNSQGNKLWEKVYGGASDDHASAIVQTQDGGYILAGGTNSFGAGGYDVYVIKLNSQGNKIWEKVYGGTKTDYASAILQTQDGRYVLAGATNSFGAYGYNIYILKLTNDGGLQYQKTYGGNVDDYASSIVQTQDGGYILAGGTSSFGSGGYDVYVAKIDSSCELKWQKTLGGSAADRGYSIAQTSDGRYIIAGETFSFGAGENDMYVIKMNAEANAGPKPAAKARIDKTFFSPLPYQKFILPFYFK